MLQPRNTNEPARTAAPAAPRLVLASRSPRRRLLLSEHGFAHEAAPAGADDSLLVRGRVTPSQWVEALAYLKARAGLDSLSSRHSSDAVVLGADTVVVKDGRIIGQPASADDAARTVRLLENGSHDVLTGVAILRAGAGRRILFADAARVHVGAVGESRIDGYIRSGDWRGKAGAYNLAERIDAGWPLRCDGDPGTVMGLPMRRLAPLLARLLGQPGQLPRRLAP